MLKFTTFPFRSATKIKKILILTSLCVKLISETNKKGVIKKLCSFNETVARNEMEGDSNTKNFSKQTTDTYPQGILKKRLQSVGIIPARYASSRFEGKPLADLLGKPMVQHVYESACRAKTLDAVIVATDDQRIYDAVIRFGGNVEMTGQCATGTERVAVVAERLTCDIVANIQGDEPLLEPAQIDLMLQPFIDRPEVQVCTLKQRVETAADYQDVNVVKVVTDLQGDALYFSRASVPGQVGETELHKSGVYRHVGLYAYRREQLLAFTRWSSTPYELAEGLEQLRFLEHGVPIHVVETDTPLIGVDVPADLERVKQILEASL